MIKLFYTLFSLFSVAILSSQSLWAPEDFLGPKKLSDSVFSQTIQFSQIDYPLLDAAVFLATNETRKAQGRKELQWSPELERTAWNYGKRMAQLNFFSHEDPTDPTRKTLDQRGRRSGITNPHLAENIATTFGIQYDSGVPVYTLQGGAGGYSLVPFGDPIPNHTYRSLALAVVLQWMNSPGHRANILSPNARQLGAGMYFFRDAEAYNGMPMFAAVQNFQWYDDVIPGTSLDPNPF